MSQKLRLLLIAFRLDAIKFGMVLKHFRFVLLLSCLVACTPTVAQRGNMLEDYQISEVKPNIHTRTDVLRILGSPTTQATFDPNIWYYIGQETEKRGILDPEVVKEKIYVVAFDEQGIVRNVQPLARGRIDVPIDTARTPTHGNDPSLMQELFGNLGRFNTQSQGPQ